MTEIKHTNSTNNVNIEMFFFYITLIILSTLRRIYIVKSHNFATFVINKIISHNAIIINY